MSTTIRTCPACEQVNPGTSVFCPNCGQSLAAVPPVLVPKLKETFFFDVPAFLRDAERRRRHRHEPGSGAGWLWLGGLLIAIPVLLTVNVQMAAATWTAGLLLVAFGFYRMRSDRRLLANAGIAFNLVAVAILGGISYRTVHEPTANGSVASLSAATADAESAAAPSSTAEATTLGTVAMFRGDAQHTGVHPGPVPEGHPDLKWQLDTAGEVYSSPVISAGTVFIGAKSGYIYAVDEKTGKEQWNFDLGDYVIVRSSPAVSNQTVYVGGGYNLFAIDQESGREKWRLEIPYASQSSPTITGGVVYVSSQEGHVYAVDANTGKQLWHFQIDGLIFSSPAVSKGTVYIGSDDGNLYAISAESGKMIWKMPTGGEVYSSPAVSDGKIYVTSKSRVTYALSQQNGSILWQHPVGGESSPAVSNGIVYVGSEDGGLYALNADTGEPKWLFPTGSPIISSPAVVGDTVFVASGSTVYAVDAKTGNRIWNFATSDSIESSPAVVDGMLFIGSRDGFLYAIGGDHVDNALATTPDGSGSGKTKGTGSSTSK
ncbi:MAG: PQQ-binding-like beta-propeller repeat protein [Thermomicrobiales bacterium]